MKARRFNSIMPAVNEIWAGQVLGMEVNSKKGPDLIDDSKVMEIKFHLNGEECHAEKYHESWKVLEYQMAYGDVMNSFWGLGLYEMNLPVSEIRPENIEALEEMVLKRVLWVVPWDWMLQFPPSHTKGESSHSSWENTLRYPKLKDIPETQRTYRVKKGLVHLTEGVNPRYFDFLKSRKKQHLLIH